MTSYATQADLEALIPEDALLLLTDEAGTGQIDSAVVETALANAGEVIDSYLAGRYSLPLVSVPPMLKLVSVRLAGHELHVRRNELPQTWEKLYGDAIRFLEQVASGKITLGAADPEPPTSTSLGVAAPAAIFIGNELEKY